MNWFKGVKLNSFGVKEKLIKLEANILSGSDTIKISILFFIIYLFNNHFFFQEAKVHQIFL